MKTQKTTLEQLLNFSFHPSTVLFRSIELKTIFNNTFNVDFFQPSVDLGCGNGEIAELLFSENFTYGVDNGEAKDVEDAIKNKLYKKVFLESAEKMSLPDNSVNFVFSNCVIEHIPDNNAVLGEVSRILKKGGAFVFTIPSHNFPDYLYLTNKFTSYGLGFLSRFYKYRRNKMLNQFHCYSVLDWEKKLAKYAFRIEKYQYYMSKESLMLWDRMALEVFIRRIFDKNIEIKIFRKHEKIIRKAYEDDIIKDDKGAGLFINCVKE